MSVLRPTAVLILLTSSAFAAATAGAPNSPEFFETKIRPLLATNCYSCHTNTALGGLRLDSRGALLKGGKSGAALAPGDPAKSLLIEVVQQTNPDPKRKMPMGGKLKPNEIEDLTAWVKAGAVWPESANPAAGAKSGEYVITPEQRAFWSFQPIRKVTAPTPKNETWAKTDIDRFVLAKLDDQGLTPVKPADKRTLLRRATLDLTGLPPTPEDFAAFQKDESPDAFAKVVDKLLESPHYGERWGRFWLDVARFGEDDYRSLDPMRRGMNPYPFAYLYRDWVVRAFNNDMPYDQFVKAQLAGDQMDESVRAKTLPGTGFLGLGPWYYDNGAVEITKADERHDRVDVVTRGFLGITTACARCHDHKYDPIPTKDYYALAGVFVNTVYRQYPLVPKEIHEEYKQKEKRIEDKQKLVGELLSNESAMLSQTLAFQTAKYMQSAWKVMGEKKEDTAQVADADKLDYEILDRWVKFLAKPPKFYPYLTKWQEMVKQGGSPEQAKKLAEEFQDLVIDVLFQKRDMKEENEIIYAKSLEGTKKKKPANLPNEFITNDDFCPGCGLELKTMPLERMNLWTDLFQRNLDGTDDMLPGFKFRPGLFVFRGWSLERQLSAERQAYLEGVRKDIEAMKKALPAQFPYVHGVEDAAKPVELKVHLRGNPMNLGEEVPRHFLSVLAPAGQEPARFSKGSGRLELAEAILKEPLAMRVIVNRVWKAHFGTGIVDTPSNFGIMGERPTNPDLLEYLAQKFKDDGLSMKKLHRAIMLSSVYQLGGDFVKEAYDKDSANRYYWRFDRHRMDAEQIRDSVLLVSGNLDEKMGGPSAPLSPEYRRRTLYGKVSRYKLDEYLQLFDFPSPGISAEKRFSTNVPLQRLFFMNSDFMQQQAELLAKRVASETTQTARIQKAYQIIYGREASETEVAAGIDYLKNEPMREYEERKAADAKKKKDGADKADKPEKADAAAADGEDDAPPPPESMMSGVMGGRRNPGAQKKLLPPTTWGRYAKVLLSASEFIYVQ